MRTLTSANFEWYRTFNVRGHVPKYDPPKTTSDHWSREKGEIMKSKLVQKKPNAGALSFLRESRFNLRQLFSVAFLGCLLFTAVVNAAGDSFLPGPTRVVSTVPANGDGNPYGVAFVPPGFPAGGTISPGDVLVSNFNNAPTATGGNLQGTGTTIVDVPPNAPLTLFFQSATPTGLTTALNILRAGFVLVGNFPSADGMCSDAGPGSILVIDKNGNLVSTITESVQGPWDSALFDRGSTAKYFVANALTGAINRYDLGVSAAGVTVNKVTQIASGYMHSCDPVTFVDAPTGLVYDPESDVLYVASTLDNAVYAVSNAAGRTHDGGIGRLIYSDPKHLHGALGLAKAPNGDLLVTNNDAVNADPAQPSELVEFTVDGEFIKQISLDPTPGGSFGLAVENLGNGTAKLAAVDDSVNLFVIWTLKAQ